MKRINTTKLMALLASLCLITSSFVGSTLAKYTTEVSGSDTARVAKFGVQLTADADLFDKEYDGAGAISVQADDDKDVIAPGTTGTATIFTIAGAPEVDVDVYVSLSGDKTITTDDLTIATLPAGTYKDYVNLSDANENFTLTDAYKPVKWTLKKDGNIVSGYNSVNLDEIETYFASISKKYEVESKDFAAIVGTYELTWEWEFAVNDYADTYMGQIAAGVEGEPSGYEANESFNFVLNVTQVD